LNPISSKLHYIGQVSQSDPRFLTDLEGACGCLCEKGTQSFVRLTKGLWCSTGPETQGGPLALRLHHSTIPFASLVWSPGCQMTSATKRLAWLGIIGVINTSLAPLELVVQGEARSAAHCLWSLGCWYYLQPNLGHSSILMQLQKSDPTFNIRADVMRPAFNLKPKYRVTMLTREEWTRGAGTPPGCQGEPGRSLWTILGKEA
jgi:hypothetical protein